MTNQPAEAPAQGVMNFTVQGKQSLEWVTPNVTVDGYPMRTAFGLNRIPLYAGTHTVEASRMWLWRYGHASLTFTLEPGQQVPVFYAPPMFTFMKGRMGHEKQKRPGLAGMWAFYLVLVLLIIFAVIFGFKN